MAIDKISRLKQENAALIKLLTDFFIKHERGASKKEIRIAAKDNQETIFKSIDRLEHAGILKKEYMINKHTNEYHACYVPSDILDEYLANKDKKQQESINNQIFMIRQIHWITKVKAGTKIKHFIYKAIGLKKKATELYNKATEVAIIK